MRSEAPSPSLGLRQYQEKGCPTKEGQTCVEIEGSTPGQFPIVSILSVIIENLANPGILCLMIECSFLFKFLNPPGQPLSEEKKGHRHNQVESPIGGRGNTKMNKWKY